MAKNPYNGFTPQQRSKAGRWIRRQRANGLRAPHTQCCACLREGGSVAGHSENYSFPYGPHIGEYGLCFPCHMAVHHRFKMPDQWNAYRFQVAQGRRYPDMTQYGRWIVLFKGHGYNPPVVQDPCSSTWLDTLLMGEAECASLYQTEDKIEDEQSLF